MSYDLRFIKRTLYTLKRDFGLPLNIVWRDSSSANLETGEKTVVKDSQQVSRGIILPSTVDRNFVYDLAFIASNKNFTYGGFFDQQRRRVIIDKDDLPSDFKIEVGYYIVFNGNRYEVERVDEFEHNAAYVLQAKQIANIDVENINYRQNFSLLFFEHEVEVQLD